MLAIWMLWDSYYTIYNLIIITITTIIIMVITICVTFIMIMIMIMVITTIIIITIIIITFIFTIIIAIIVICLSVCSCTPLMGPRLTLRSVSPSNCLEEVIELATLNPLCYPNSYLSELQPEAAVPDFHWRGLVGQFATGRQHLPQF